MYNSIKTFFQTDRTKVKKEEREEEEERKEEEPTTKKSSPLLWFDEYPIDYSSNLYKVHSSYIGTIGPSYELLHSGGYYATKPVPPKEDDDSQEKKIGLHLKEYAEKIRLSPDEWRIQTLMNFGEYMLQSPEFSEFRALTLDNSEKIDYSGGVEFESGSEHIEGTEEMTGPQPKRGRGRPTREEAEAKRIAQEAQEKAERERLIAELRAEVQAEQSPPVDAVAQVWGLVAAGAESMINMVRTEITNESRKSVQEIENYIDKIRKQIEGYKTIVTVDPEGITKSYSGLMHKMIPDLIKVIHHKRPIMMVGPAASGKTFASAQVADILGRSYYTMSVGSQTSKSDLLGFINANGNYVTTHLRQAVEFGGIFLLDEVDAGNPNVLVVLNALLAGGVCSFPDKMVEIHEDFILLASANTFGNGASRQYVGRNQLDAATLDRFTTLYWDYDLDLERSMIGHLSHAERWLRVIMALRDIVNSRGLRVIVSPRTTVAGAELLEDGYSLEEVIRMRVLSTAPEDTHAALLSTVKAAW